MSHMTEESVGLNRIVIAGRVLGFTPPNQGQFESMVRISKAIKRGAEDGDTAFWEKQVDRIGTLIESMINEGDRETLDHLLLTGKTNSNELIGAILTEVRKVEEASTKPAAKVTKARVQRN